MAERMTIPDLPIRHNHGVYSVMLSACRCSILRDILDPAIPFVWIRRHVPNEVLEWHRACVPLSADAQSLEVEVRGLEFDIQLPTRRFLELLPAFEEHGIELCQMAQRVPNTLTLSGIREEAVNGVLIENGLYLKFFLPHAVECASLASPKREVLEGVLSKPHLRERAYWKR